MEPLIRIGKPLFRLLTAVSFSICATIAQTPPSGRCVASSVPVQVRSEGLTERLGDIVLQCSGLNPGTSFSANLTLFFPVNVTNRVDSNNLTHDAVISVDSGSGFVPNAVAGQITNQIIAFNGINLTPPPGGSLNLKISGIRANVHQLGLLAPQPDTPSLSSPLPVTQAQLVVAFPQLRP